MRIDGKEIAASLYADVMERIATLEKWSVTPKLAVILVGDDPGSVNYVSQKEKHATLLGIALQIERLPVTVTEEQLRELVENWNNDPDIHGIIIQRPAPVHIKKDILDYLVLPEKDVDGFHPNSDFAAPVALAVERILYDIYTHEKPNPDREGFLEWLLSRYIVVLGKGQTAGAPIINHFHGRNAQIITIDSQTENPLGILQDAEIVISAVGKKDVLLPDMLTRDAIVIGVGLHDENGKLRGDYRDSLMEGAVAYYTPTPGGVGPVNVAMLLGNVVRAAEEQIGNV